MMPGRLRVALVKAGEPIPGWSDGRTQRMGGLARELLARNHEVVWYTNNVDRIDGKQIASGTHRFEAPSGEEMVVFGVPGFGTRTSPMRLFSQFLTAGRTGAALLHGERPDVVVAAYPYLESAFAAVAIGRIRKIPTIVDVRDLYPDNYEDALVGFPDRAVKLLLAPFRKMSQATFKQATQRVAISSDYLRWMCERFSVEPRATDEAIPLPAPRAASPERYGGEPAADEDRSTVSRASIVKLVYVGSFNRIIDIRTVVRAARDLEADGIDSFRLTLIGAGERERDFAALVEGSLCINHLGWLDSSSVDRALRSADWGLAPYEPARASGMGNKYFEYMQLGLPVATSDAFLGAELEAERAGGHLDLTSVEACRRSLQRIVNRQIGVDRRSVESYYAGPLMGGRSSERFADLVESTAQTR